MSDADSDPKTSAGARRRVIFVNRYFAPDVSATSQILSDLAFHLAGRGREIHVVCGDTLYAGGDKSLPREEIVDGVHVHRVSGGRFGRAGLGGRAADYLALYASLRRRLWSVLRQGDILVAKTDPPLLTIPLAGLARKRGVIFIPWLQDLYPEVAAALGVPFVGSAERPLTILRDRSLRKADGIVAIGTRMRDRLTARGMDAKRVHVIANWSDDSDIVPVPRAQNPLRAAWGLTDKFVVGYSGNLGRAHEYRTLIEAAERLRNREDIAFLFIGGGHHAGGLKDETLARGIGHLFHFEPYQERARLAQSLSVPDVHWLSLRPELEGLIVPSKFYGIAAAGRAVINVGAPDGEVAELVTRFGCGVTVSPGDGAGLANVIERLMRSPDETRARGERGRDMLVSHYSTACAMARWENLLDGFDYT